MSRHGKRTGLAALDRLMSLEAGACELALNEALQHQSECQASLDGEERKFSSLSGAPYGVGQQINPLQLASASEVLERQAAVIVGKRSDLSAAGAGVEQARQDFLAVRRKRQVLAEVQRKRDKLTMDASSRRTEAQLSDAWVARSVAT